LDYNIKLCNHAADIAMSNCDRLKILFSLQMEDSIHLIGLSP